MFIVVPSDTELNTTVNFYDNTADTGGSPPVRGQPLPWWTQTTFEHTAYRLFPGSPYFQESTQLKQVSSEKRSVVVEVNLDYATPPASTINDLGTGRFEIGATDATDLNDQHRANRMVA